MIIIVFISMNHYHDHVVAYLMHMSMLATFLTAAITFLFNCGFVLLRRLHIIARNNSDILTRWSRNVTRMIVVITCWSYQAQ